MGEKSETRAKQEPNNAKEEEKRRRLDETGEERPGLLLPETHQAFVGGGIGDVHERARHHRAMRGSQQQQQQRRNPSAPCRHSKAQGRRHGKRRRRRLHQINGKRQL